MAQCKSCAAPLPSNTNRCVYCNVRNDIDLQKSRYSAKTIHPDRNCPHCKISLHSIQIKGTTSIELEHCEHCFGVFFDPGEIQELLENSVSQVFEIDLPLLKSINRDRYKKDHAVKYIRCPVCQILMNRVNFAHRSGVVIDQCKKHGIWLDSGEITHLLEWKKAGGELLHEKNKKESKKKPSKSSSSNKDKASLLNYKETNERSYSSLSSRVTDDQLFNSVSSLISKLF